MMRQNIGIVNALIRITCGLTMLAWATAKLVRCPSSTKGFIIAILGSMKVGEGITRYCPVTHLYEEKMHPLPATNELASKLEEKI